MFDLKTNSFTTVFTCPDCGCKFGQAVGWTFLGTHVIADCVCECCENKYFHTLPIGHAALFPISFSQKTLKTRFDDYIKGWLAAPLIDAVRTKKEVEREILCSISKKSNNVILLNCLDSCYGHVFLKLVNAQKYLNEFPEKQLIVIIPSSFEWMVPKGVAEIWKVEATLSDFNFIIKGLDAFIKKEILRFQFVTLSDSPVHPDLSVINFKEYLKTDKFNLQDFEKKPTTISFILREDRFWLPTKIDSFLMQLSISKGWMKWMKPYFVLKQNSLVRKLAKKIKQKSTTPISFYAAGIGKTGNLGDLIHDLRKESINTTIELEWCELYSTTSIVIGIHGSNMLIPTALSAGFIELLPRYKLYNLTEDIAMNHKGRFMHFLGRFLDEFSSVELVAEHAVSIIKRFPLVKKNMEH